MRISAIGRDAAQLTRLQTILAARLPQPPAIYTHHGGLEQVSQAADHDRADVIILDQLCSTADDLSALAGPLERHPGLAYVLIGESTNAEWLLAGVRRGIRDVLALPVEPAVLNAAIERIERTLKARSAPEHSSTVAAFIGCKGGSGASFLAANTAYLIATESTKTVVLLDFDIDGGDASLFLTDQEPVTTLADVAQQVERLDCTLLASSLLRILPNLGVLAAPESLEQSLAISADHADAVINRASEDNDCVIIDLGHSFNRVTVRAIDAANVVFVVMQMSLPFIRDARRALTTLQALGVGEERIQLIVNRHESNATLAIEDVEKALGRRVSLVIPNSYRAVTDSVNQGIPIGRLDASNAVTKCIRELAQKRFGAGATKPTRSGVSAWVAKALGRA